VPGVATTSGPEDPALRRLAALVAARAPRDGVFELGVPGLYASRRSSVHHEAVHATVGPSLCIVAQGAKTLLLGKETFEYDAARMLVFSVDLPVIGHVTRATPVKPYLGIRLDLDPMRIGELTMRVYPHGVPRPTGMRGLYVGVATAGIVEAAVRLVELMSDPADKALLAPLVVDEILIRLLRSSIGGRVAQIGYSESGVYRVAKAVAWLKANFGQPVSIDELADLVHMSVSSFHQRFKAVTSMSPLQYQKLLRLNEARRLMLFQDLEAGLAARQVGYLSASQFSREYARVFGSAPTKDIARLRSRTVNASQA
jgi:AraC-like DNA-binding protein